MIRRPFLAVLSASLLAGLAAAQGSAPGGTALEEARLRAETAERRSTDLSGEAERAAEEAIRARARAEAMVAEIRGAEEEVIAAEKRLKRIDLALGRQTAWLAERRQPVAQLTAALQIMARRPPATALVQPGSLDETLRTRALLASALPEITKRTAALRTEMAAAQRLRERAAGVARGLRNSRASLQERQVELARLEALQLRRSAGLADASLIEEDRSIAFSEEARELAAAMESDSYRRRVQADLAALPAPLQRPFRSVPDAPARRAAYLIPVEGRLLQGVGELSDAGIHSRGLTFESRRGAPVVAPRAGRILYAGGFRGYGEIVIIDHGGGWTSTITGLGALRVRRGERVAAGTMLGPARGAVSVELRRGAEPQPITPYI